jgi:uncharacterized membrane protein HdeD (DUF308 family)
VAESILNQTIFSVYEIFANIIPGTIVLVTIILALQRTFSFQNFGTLPESVFVIFLLFLTFVLGLAIQGISAFLESYIDKKKYGGYPSSFYLDSTDKTFPDYLKEGIRKFANKEFGTPLDASSQHVFDLCYTYVLQKNVSARVLQFLRTYTFARNMIVAMVIEAAACFYLSFQQQELWVSLAGVISLCLSYIFYTRFLRYGKSFGQEVLRSFFIDRASSHAHDKNEGNE